MKKLNSDLIMENIAVSDALGRAGFSDNVINRVDRVLKNYDVLLEAAKYAQEHLVPRGDVNKDYSGHLAKATLSKAIYQAEGK